MIRNGVIIQDVCNPTHYVSNFNYQGIHAFHQHPLLGIADKECDELSDSILFKPSSDGMFECLEFISNKTIFNKYVDKCAALNIKIRVLFIESEYSYEVWDSEVPSLKLLGYEYCEIPFDSQIITDFNLYEPFKKFYSRLNKYGMFDNITDVYEFKKAYDNAWEKGYIGDGDMNTYVCRISEINCHN